MHTLTDLKEVIVTETQVELYYTFQAKALIRSPQEGITSIPVHLKPIAPGYLTCVQWLWRCRRTSIVPRSVINSSLDPICWWLPFWKKEQHPRKVYLPEGLWYDVWTWQSVEEGRMIEADAPLDRIPIYAKAGSIIPTLPVMQHAEEQPWNEMTIIVYPGRNDEFLLYEDDGKTTAYKRGEYRTMLFSQKNLDGKIIVNIGAETGSYPEAVEKRTYHILIPGVTASEVRMNGEPVHSIKQEEGCLAFTLEDQSVKCEINVEIVIDK